MSSLAQIGAVTAMNLRSIPQRLGASLVIVIGIAGVVGVLVSLLAMTVGFNQTAARAARADRAIVLRGGATAEMSSFVSRDNANTIGDAPGVKKDATGRPIASGEILVMMNATKRGDTQPSNIAMRGVSGNVGAVRPELRIVQGRMFEPSRYETIVGKTAQAQFQGLDVGAVVPARGVDWTIVGVFESAGDAHESELLAGADTVMTANRRDVYSAVTVMMDSADSFPAFKTALTTNPTLSVDVQRETDFYASQSQQVGTVMFFVTYFVGSIMAIGAVFGALNTMYAAVSTRTTEIATLRAIGFGAGAVVISVLAEALALALLGGVLGAAAAWLIFNGHTASTLSGNFSQMAFHLAVTWPVVGLGLAWATGVGLLGGLMPALRAARLPIVDALKAQ